MTLTGQQLVERALNELAGGSPAKLVRALRLNNVMDSVDPAAQVRRWRDGKHDPSYAVTMRLLEGLGLLREDATTPEQARMFEPQTDPVEIRLAELATELNRQRAATTKSLRALTRAIERQANQPETKGPQEASQA